MSKIDLKQALRDTELLKEATIAAASDMLAQHLRGKSAKKLFKEEYDEFSDEDEDLLGDVELDAEVEEEVDPTLNPADDAEEALDVVVPDENVIENDETETEDEFYEDEMGDETFDADLDEMLKEFDDESEGEEEVLTDDEVAGDDEFEDEGDIDLDEIIRELEGLDKDETQPEVDPGVNTVDDETERIEERRRMRNKISEQKKRIATLENTLSKITKSLSETNLLNQKLGYAFKLFNKFALNKTEKMKVVESFDRAKSERDVKLVFTTLAETLTRAANKAGKTTPRRRTTNVVESVDRTQRVRGRVVNENIVDEDTIERSRILRLAGIKTN
jgi:hypothetical protein